ncbi:uncharacterized protein LOC126661656 [Mercurialis annua]|uniref:uncharacterized protein LOC126661656 n=1 Tax=Mercurialis annua TaxID=3986 RepID=UPI00215E4C74|nr:uncharacterized protein LOC126661656 [Mercurialis annua]
MIEENPRQWHVLLSEAVWANRTSQKSTTGTLPFRMVYGYDAMLPMELTVMSTRRLYQNKLSKDYYFDKMVKESLDLDEERLAILDHLEAQKRRVERAYNKRVKQKSFEIGDMGDQRTVSKKICSQLLGEHRPMIVWSQRRVMPAANIYRTF